MMSPLPAITVTAEVEIASFSVAISSLLPCSTLKIKASSAPVIWSNEDSEPSKEPDNTIQPFCIFNHCPLVGAISLSPSAFWDSIKNARSSSFSLAAFSGSTKRIDHVTALWLSFCKFTIYFSAYFLSFTACLITAVSNVANVTSAKRPVKMNKLSPIWAAFTKPARV